jgi:multidrug resistance efflux pump
VQSAQENLNQTLRQVETLKAQRLSAEAGLAQAKAQLNQAQVNLERTRILAPVDGYVTNLLAQLGDYVNVGVNTISLVDANSFWVDGYFDETNLGPIRVGDPAQIKLMGGDQIVRGHVDSIARAINVANAQPNSQGVATVNPIFTWVRLAQRVPVRIHIDEVPPNVVLWAGMTTTVEILDRGRAPERLMWASVRALPPRTPHEPSTDVLGIATAFKNISARSCIQYCGVAGQLAV